MSFTLNFILLLYLTVHCHVIVCPTVTCNFEIDECAWNMDSTWQVYPSGSSPETASSGPISDHTSGVGSYARFLASRLPESDQFGLMSTNTSLQTSTEFSFWYFMHGTQIGTLSLLVNEQVLWQKSKRQGVPAWYLANLTLPVGSDLRLVFSANRTSLGRSSDIALDDILLEGEAIPSTRTTMSRPTTTPRTRSNASCDFDIDKDLCGWKSDTKYGWIVLSQREENATFGPASDYSSIARGNDDGKVCKIPYDNEGDQYYCLPNKKRMQCKGADNKVINCRDGGFLQIFSGTFDDVGERSQFESPVLDALSTEGCVQFQYNIDGTDNDWLNVYVVNYWTGLVSCMWHKNGSTVPNRWIEAEAPLRLESNGKYKIVFEARKGQADGQGVVSIDHIVISSKKCSGIFVVEQCPVEETTTTTTSTKTPTVMTTTETSTSTLTGTTVATTTFEQMTTTTTTSMLTVTFTDIAIPERTTKKPSISTAVIVGIVIGVLVAIALVITLGVILVKHVKPVGQRVHHSHHDDEIDLHFTSAGSTEASVRLGRSRGQNALT